MAPPTVPLVDVEPPVPILGVLWRVASTRAASRVGRSLTSFVLARSTREGERRGWMARVPYRH